jgi:hypothetical protein
MIPEFVLNSIVGVSMIPDESTCIVTVNVTSHTFGEQFTGCKAFDTATGAKWNDL